MDTQNISRQLRYLEEVRFPLHRAGFGTLPLEGEQLPVLWNGVPLCRITGKGSVFYRREDADTPQAEDALFRVEDIAAKTLEYSLNQLPRSELIMAADEISAMATCRAELMALGEDLSRGKMIFLLRQEKPLELLSEAWMERRPIDEGELFQSLLIEVYEDERQQLLNEPLML